MRFIVKTTPEEVVRARKWWNDLEMQWKMAYNEAVFGKGPTIEPPKEDEMMMLVIGIDTLRFAGPLAPNPNITSPLTNLSGLIPLYQLTYLSVSHMRIRSLKELYRFTKMEHLFLYDNQLESIEGIEKMASLKNLYLQNNNINNLTAIKKLTHIHTLYVSGNKFQKISGLTKKHAKSLKKFYVMPNDDLPDSEVIRIQNKLGILCRTG